MLHVMQHGCGWVVKLLLVPTLPRGIDDVADYRGLLLENKKWLDSIIALLLGLADSLLSVAVLPL